MTIKVCGMRDPDNIRAVEALGIDMMGLIFYPRSSRYVEAVPNYLPTRCKRVGVFVDADADFIRQHATDYGLDWVQLHGDESPALCSTLQGLHLIKAISIPSRTSGTTPTTCRANDSCGTDASYIDALTSPFEGLVEYFLFETKCEGYGGSGKQFDWTVLSHYHGNTPFLLTGGIGPDDAGRVKAFSHPQFAGIDLNSRFEHAPAVKDIQALEQFINTIKDIQQ